MQLARNHFPVAVIKLMDCIWLTSFPRILLHFLSVWGLINVNKTRQTRPSLFLMLFLSFRLFVQYSWNSFIKRVILNVHVSYFYLFLLMSSSVPICGTILGYKPILLRIVLALYDHCKLQWVRYWVRWKYYCMNKWRVE